MKIEMNAKTMIITNNIIIYIGFTFLLGWFPIAKSVIKIYQENGLLALISAIILVVLIELFVYFIYSSLDNFSKIDK